MSYTRMTELFMLQVTWNQVQGYARVGSQLCSTLFGSFHANLCLYSMSPSVLQLASIAWERRLVSTAAATSLGLIAQTWNLGHKFGQFSNKDNRKDFKWYQMFPFSCLHETKLKQSTTKNSSRPIPLGVLNELYSCTTNLQIIFKNIFFCSLRNCMCWV